MVNVVGTDQLQPINEVTSLYVGLDRLSYYDFLGVRPQSDYFAIREAFYARAQQFHPDRFVASRDSHSREAVYAVYKRMTEAYNVLSDPELRQAYDAVLAEGEVRLPPEKRSRRLDADERQLSNPFARVYLRSGRKKFEEGRLQAAWIDVELGLSLEEAPPLQALRDRIASRMNQAPLGRTER